MSAISIEKICADLNAQAGDLAPRLLPNGHYSQDRRHWLASGIPDRPSSGARPSESLRVDLTGSRQGHWHDFGNCHADEQKGDMLDLVRLKLCGGDQRSAIAEAKAMLGISDDFVPGPRYQPSAEEMAARATEARAREEARQNEAAKDREARARGARALYLHRDSSPIAGTPAEAYLRRRSISPGDHAQGARIWPGALRFHPEVYHGKLKAKVPAMLAPMYLADGRHMATHRTFIEQVNGVWRKISASDAKMVIGPSGGAFVPINKGSSGKSMRSMPEGEPVFVTEGIEDALVVRMMRPEARIVAAYSLDNIGMMVLPEAAKSLVICCDNDPAMAAQDKLERAIARQQARGLKVRLVRPPLQFKDMNDWLVGILAQRGQAA